MYLDRPSTHKTWCKSQVIMGTSSHIFRLNVGSTAMAITYIDTHISMDWFKGKSKPKTMVFTTN